MGGLENRLTFCATQLTLTSTSPGSNVGTGTSWTDASWPMLNFEASLHAVPKIDLFCVANAFMTGGIDAAIVLGREYGRSRRLRWLRWSVCYWANESRRQGHTKSNLPYMFPYIYLYMSRSVAGGAKLEGWSLCMVKVLDSSANVLTIVWRQPITNHQLCSAQRRPVR